jgi:hypothetical protein
MIWGALTTPFGRPALPHVLRRRLCAWIGLVLLAFNLAAGTGLQAAPLPIAAPGDQVICTAGGIVIIHEDGAAPTTERSGDGFCVFCLPLLNGGVSAPTAELPLDRPILGQALSVRPASVVIPLAHPLSVAAPRAPPTV